MVRNSTTEAVGEDSDLARSLAPEGDGERIGRGSSFLVLLTLSVLGWAAVAGLVFMAL